MGWMSCASLPAVQRRAGHARERRAAAGRCQVRHRRAAGARPVPGHPTLTLLDLTLFTLTLFIVCTVYYTPHVAALQRIQRALDPGNIRACAGRGAPGRGAARSALGSGRCLAQGAAGWGTGVQLAMLLLHVAPLQSCGCCYGMRASPPPLASRLLQPLLLHTACKTLPNLSSPLPLHAPPSASLPLSLTSHPIPHPKPAKTVQPAAHLLQTACRRCSEARSWSGWSQRHAWTGAAASRRSAPAARSCRP